MAGPVLRGRFSGSTHGGVSKPARARGESEAHDPMMQIAQSDETVNKILGPLNIGLMIGGFASFIAGGIDMTRKAGGWAWNKIRGGKPSETPRTLLNAVTFENIGGDKAAHLVAAPTHGILGSIADTTGLSTWRVNANINSFHKHFAAAKDISHRIPIQGLEEGAVSHLRTLASAVQSGDPAHLARPEVMESLRTLEQARLSGDASKFITRVSKAVEHKNGALAWSNVSQTVKEAPKTLAKTPVMHGLMNGSFIAMSGLSMFMDSREFLQNLELLKQMHADITGRKISTAGVLFGNVPPIIAESRAHLWKLLGVKMSADLVNIGLNIKMIITRHLNPTVAIVGMMGSDAVSRGASTLMGEPITVIYKTISLALKKGEPVEAQAYSALLLAASADLRNHKSGKEFAAKLAEIYAAGKVNPGEVLKKVNSGEIVQDIKRITVAADAAAQPAPENETSMVQKLKEGNNRAAPAKTDKPILGKHTNQVVSHEAPNNIVTV